MVTTTGPGPNVIPDGADAELFPPGHVAFAFENYMTGSLPVTGAEWRGLLIAAGALVLGGATVLVPVRRRSTLHA